MLPCSACDGAVEAVVQAYECLATLEGTSTLAQQALVGIKALNRRAAQFVRLLQPGALPKQDARYLPIECLHGQMNCFTWSRGCIAFVASTPDTMLEGTVSTLHIKGTRYLWQPATLCMLQPVGYRLNEVRGSWLMLHCKRPVGCRHKTVLVQHCPGPVAPTFRQ